NLIVRIFVAVVVKADDPCGLRAGQFGTKFRMGNDDVLYGVRPQQHPGDVSAILPNAEQDDDSNKHQPAAENPLPRSQEIGKGHYCRGASANVIGISICLLARTIVMVTFSPALYRSTSAASSWTELTDFPWKLKRISPPTGKRLRPMRTSSVAPRRPARDAGLFS